MRLILNSLTLFVRSIGSEINMWLPPKGISGYGMVQTEEEMKEICRYPT